MKQAKFLLTALLCLMMSAVCRADDTPIAPDALPAAAKSFVTTHFPQQKIIYAEKDWNSYECRLDNGVKIEFNKKGNWDKVDCHMMPVPAAIVPEAILKYVKATFPDCSVTKIDKERYGFDVELSNDIDLKFSHQGTLLGMDD